MFFVDLVSIGIRLFAVVVSWLLVRRHRDWRLEPLTITVAVLAGSQIPDLFVQDEGVKILVYREMAALAISLLVLASLYFLHRALSAYEKRELEREKQIILYRGLWEALPEPAWRTSSDETPTLINPALKRLVSGASTDREPFEPAKMLAGDASGDSSGEVLPLTPSQPSRRRVYQLGTKAGDRWYRWTEGATFDDAGKLESMLAVGFDSTDEYEVERRRQFIGQAFASLPVPALLTESKAGSCIVEVANSAFAAMVGKSVAEVEGRSLVDLLGAAMANDDLLRIGQAGVESQSLTLQAACRGETYDIAATPLTQVQGRDGLVAWVWHDVTTRVRDLDAARSDIAKLAEELQATREKASRLTEELQESRREVASLTEELEKAREQTNRISAIIDSLPIVVFDVDHHGGQFTPQFVGGRCEGILGVSRDDVLGRAPSWMPGLLPDDGVIDVSTTRETKSRDVRIGNEGRWLRTLAIPRVGRDGSPGWAGAILDFSATKLKALSDQEALEQFQGILGAMPDLLIATDADLAVEKVYGSVEGLVSESLVGHNLAEQLASEAAVIDQACERAGRGSGPVELTLQLRSLGERFFGTRVAALSGGPGSGGFLFALRDVTKWLDYERRLHASERRIGEAERGGRAGTWRLDLQDGRFEWSPGLFTLLERDPEMGPPDWNGFLALTEEPRRSEVEKVRQIAVDQGETYVVEWRHSPSDERHHWIRERGWAERDASGRIVAVNGYLVDVTDTFDSSARLQRSIDFLTELFATTPAPMILIDDEGRIERHSNEWLRLVGEHPDGWVGRDWLEQSSSDRDREEAQMALELLQEQNEASTWTHALLTADVTERTFSWAAAPVLDAAERRRGILVVGHDLTSLQETERSLRRSRDRYQAVLEQAPIPLLLLDVASARCLQLNTSAQRLLGWSQEEAPSRTLFELAVDGDAVAMRESWGGIAHDEVVDVRVSRLDEERQRLLRVVAQRVKGEDWEAALAVVDDVSELRDLQLELARQRDDFEQRIQEILLEWEEKINRERERFQHLLGSLDDALLTTDARHTITLCAGTSDRLFGRTTSELIGAPIEEFLAVLPDEFRGRVDTETRPILISEPLPSRIAVKRSDGTIVPAEVTRTRFQGQDEVVYVYFLRDIRERATRERLELRRRVMESLKVMARGLAGDFGHWLAVIYGYADLASSLVDPKGRLYGYVDRSRIAAAHASEVVSQLLAFSGACEQRTLVIDVGTLVEQLEPQLVDVASPHAELRLHVPTEPALALVDPRDLRIIVTSLVEHATAVVGDLRGVIDLNVTLGDRSESFDTHLRHYVCVSVRESVSTLHEEDADRLFEPFYQSASGDLPRGMQLAVVHGLATASRGRVEAKGLDEGGSAISVYLPRAEEGTPHGDVPDLISQDQQSSRVLLVVTHEALREMLEETLGVLGHSVTHCANARGALARFEQDFTNFDLVVAEQSLADLSGDYILREMKRLNPDLKVLLLAGYGDEVSAEALEELGLETPLHMPVGRREIAEAVARLG
ncbi:PAS domain S-box protein [Kolteria novifilia]